LASLLHDALGIGSYRGKGCLELGHSGPERLLPQQSELDRGCLELWDVYGRIPMKLVLARCRVLHIHSRVAYALSRKR